MPPISFLVILPEPISSPLYTCLESAEIISPLNFLATFTANALFPLAVGPRITIIFLLNSICSLLLFLPKQNYFYYIFYPVLSAYCLPFGRLKLSRFDRPVFGCFPKLSFLEFHSVHFFVFLFLDEAHRLQTFWRRQFWGGGRTREKKAYQTLFLQKIFSCLQTVS